jgi:hypothetical protein
MKKMKCCEYVPWSSPYMDAPEKSFTWTGFGLANKYKTRMETLARAKHPSLFGFCFVFVTEEEVK